MDRQPQRPGWMDRERCDCQSQPTLANLLVRALLLAEGWTALLIALALVRASSKRRRQL